MAVFRWPHHKALLGETLPVEAGFAGTRRLGGIEYTVRGETRAQTVAVAVGQLSSAAMGHDLVNYCLVPLF